VAKFLLSPQFDHALLEEGAALIRRLKQSTAGLLAASAFVTIVYGLVAPGPHPAPNGGPGLANVPNPAQLIAAIDSAGTAAILPAAAQAQPVQQRKLVIRRDESFYDAMRGLGVPHAQVTALVDACRPYRNLRRVRHGEEFQVSQETDGSLRRISFDLDEESYLAFTRTTTGFDVEELTHPVEHRLVGVSGTISASLYESLKDAAVPIILAVKMNDIMGWEIDFSRDLQRGDSFRILYEEIRRGGEFLRCGPIVALECIVGGKVHRAYRYETRPGEPGYFDERGGSLQHEMLLAPCEYSRVSSGFSLHRLHPIFGDYRPHLGVDFAAPLGTPVHAVASGTVVQAGYGTGSGRIVVIRHDHRGLETSYMHLSRFAAGIARGARVRQGQVIGNVGASGWATGPHLDYRVRMNGQPVNPLKLKLPPSDPVPPGLRDAYLTSVALYSVALDYFPSASGGPQPVALAMNVKPPLWQQPAGGLTPGNAAAAR
jgi:murein DD-endopeptidase MepM/ murein hydrolase activator NlpD